MGFLFFFYEKNSLLEPSWKKKPIKTLPSFHSHQEEVESSHSSSSHRDFALEPSEFYKNSEDPLTRETKESQHSKSDYLFQEGDFSLFYKDLEEKEGQAEEGDLHSNTSYSLEEKLNLQLLLDQKKNEYNEAQKKAFVEAFLKNALEKGYKIKLNKKLDVISIQKIQKPSFTLPADF